MKKLLLTISFAGCWFSLIDAQTTMLLDSIVERDPYNMTLKFEKFTYDKSGNTTLSTSYDNTGSYLKMDSVFHVYDSNNLVTFYERKSYPISRNYPGWHPSTKTETEYTADGKIAKTISSTYRQANQPASNTEGCYYYQSSGAIYTYDEHGRKNSYIMMSGSYNTTFGEKIKYVYEYDNSDRVTKEFTFRKDADGNWTTPDGRKTYIYSGAITKASEELSEEYDNGNWTNYGKYVRLFDTNTQKMTEEAYWKWENSIWAGSYKTVYTLTPTGATKEYESYDWTDNNWRRTNYSTYTLDSQERNVLTQAFMLDKTANEFKLNSETEYEYDQYNNQTGYAYYSYSTGVKKGTSKTVDTYDASGKKLEFNSFSWDASANKWIGKKNQVFTYNVDNTLSKITEKLFNSVFWEDYSTSTYYYSVASSIDNHLAVRPYKVIVSDNLLSVTGFTEMTQLRIYMLNGILLQTIKGIDTISCSLAPGVYVVQINQDVIKIRIN